MTEFDLTKNIRDIIDLDDTELRASMQKSGWLPQLPAFVDEGGVVVVGHRRLKIAEELRIKPVIVSLEFGSGTDADAKRLELAIASNIGAAGLSKKDRKSIAELAYQHGYTETQISKMLGVSQNTVSRDLEGLSTIDKPSRPKGGRPKGSGSSGGSSSKSNGKKKRETPVLDKAREIVRDRIDNDEPTNSRKLQDEHGISHVHFETALAVERALEEAPPVDAATLPMSAKEKLDLAIKQATRKLEREFAQRVRDEVKRGIEQSVLPAYEAEYRKYQDWIEHRKGCMSRKVYVKILARLHPDTGGDADLFDTFKKLEKVLLDEKQSPTDVPDMPKTYEELMALKQKVAAERRAKRGNQNVIRH